MSMDVREAWLRWNLNFEGVAEDLTGKVTGSIWYRENVVYTGQTPAMRFVKRGRRKPVVLVKHIGMYAPEDLKKQVVIEHCEEIGVFSRHAGDQLDDTELHARVRFIMLMETREYAYETPPKYTGKWLEENKYQADNVAKDLDAYYARYTRYNEIFDLNWPPLPEMYRDHLKAEIAQKLAQYNTPEMVTRRERVKARKLAKQALGLD